MNRLLKRRDCHAFRFAIDETRKAFRRHVRHCCNEGLWTASLFYRLADLLRRICLN